MIEENTEVERRQVFAPSDRRTKGALHRLWVCPIINEILNTQ